MANHMASFATPCDCKLTSHYEGMSGNNEEFCIDKGETVRAISFDPVNNCYLCKYGDWVTTLDENILEPLPPKTAYVLTVEVKHEDLYDQEGDGTEILGVYDDRKLAETRLEAEYKKDRDDLLDGSCRTGGRYEITEDTPPEAQKIEDRYVGSFAQLVVSDKHDGALDREYTYRIETKVINQ